MVSTHPEATIGIKLSPFAKAPPVASLPTGSKHRTPPPPRIFHMATSHPRGVGEVRTDDAADTMCGQPLRNFANASAAAPA
jgi:hypothetical protein